MLVVIPSQSSTIQQSEAPGSSASVGHLAGHTLTFPETSSLHNLDGLTHVSDIPQKTLSERHISLPKGNL
ncbi:MAG: hypothetical protein LBD69_03460 [Puniceicoccales bacterium]|jgi:hypothetical protein|nr:hypothetical protein [Puniceicoccales bacterium]